jgi:Trypsin
MRRRFWMLGVVGWMGCAPEEAELADLDGNEQAIIGGKGSTTAHDAVVMIRIGDRAQCTGTLVAPNLVLTARHCVSETDEGIQCSPSGRAIAGGNVGADFAAEELVVYGGRSAPRPMAVGKRIFHDRAENLCDHDLALVLLDREVAELPLAALRLRDDTAVGERITAVGWGLTKAGTLPSKRMQRGNVPVLDVGPSQAASAHELVVGEAICSGDSGGPALSQRGAVIAVVSYGGNGSYDPSNPAGSCLGKAARNTYTRVAPFADLVEKAFKLANHTPQLE